MYGRRRALKRKTFRGLAHTYAALVFTFIYIPVLVMVLFSFNDQHINYYWNGFTLQWYEKLFTNPAYLENLVTTLIIAVASTAISVLVGTLGAYGLTWFEFKLKKAVGTAVYIPIIVPEIILAISLLMLFDSVNIPLGYPAMILGHCTFCIPFVIVTVRGRLAGMDASCEEASMDLGANRATTFLRVTLPMIMPGVVSGAFISFTLSLDDVIISNFVSGPATTTLPVKILSMAKMGLSPEINALTTIMILVVLAGMALNSAVQARWKRPGAHSSHKDKGGEKA